MAKKTTAKSGKSDRPYSTKWWRLRRPEGMGKEEWKAFRKLHGPKSGEGHYIFGDPPGTGALQDAANTESMRVDGNAHDINWKSDSTVAPGVEDIRGKGNFSMSEAMKHRAAMARKGKTMSPGEARKHLQAMHYKVSYGPDGRAK